VPSENPSLSTTLGIRVNLLIPASAFVVAGSGHETRRKGKDLFVQLAKQVVIHSGKDNIHFIWVGGWEGEQNKSRIYSLVSEHSLEGCVHFVGQADNPLDYFGLADVFAMVSREDPYPLVCLEAAALSKPIICFAEAGGMPEFVEDDCGFIVPYLDVDEMAEKILILAENSELKEKLGINATRKVRNRHDVSVGGGEIVRIIERTLGSY
jgi:glycosyltransferase involved in cell wall biosynthesis